MKDKAVDLYCGGGGTSAGAEQTGDVEVVLAVNHWDIAVQTHSANFPNTRHINSRLDLVNPSECPPFRILFASPECTHHSRARGGRPTSDQQRSGAWDLMRWIEHHRPRDIVVENVREFREWGPVHNGKPMKSGRGAFFEAWLAAIRSAGYTVDHRLLNAADYGAATSRERLFVIARKGRRDPVWPEPTHRERIGGELPGMALPKWRAAAEVIDWSIPCPSIFSRKRPLADKTLARIEAGLRRFVGPHIVPFFGERSGQAPRSHGVDVALPCVTSHGAGGLAVPFQFQLIGRGAGRSRDIGDPVPTMVATRENHGVVVPFAVRLRNNGDAASLDDPLGTLTAGGLHHGIALPYVVQWDQQSSKGGYRGIDEPISTLVTKANQGVVVPFIAGCGARDGQSPPTSIDRPVNTIVTKDAKCVVAQFVLSQASGGAPRDVGSPVPTIVTGGAVSLAVPFLSSYYGNGGCNGVDVPTATITTKDRLSLSVAYAGPCSLWEHALAHCLDRDLRNEMATSAMGSLLRTMHELGVADIGFRMLANHELAAAQGFDPSYIFCGNKSDVTRQIGNSVSPDVAREITKAILAA